MKRYYFSEECYWDADLCQIFRGTEIVKLTESQISLMKKLISMNGRYVSQEALYLAMCPGKHVPERYMEYVAARFNCKKENEKGILLKVPEIERNKNFFHSKKKIDGGYKLVAIERNDVKEKTIENDFTNSWYSTKNFDEWNKQSKEDGSYRVNKLMRAFLQGERCKWSLLFSTYENTPVRRRVIDDIKGAIENGHSAITLISAGGEGKTTVLMQLCVELYKEGCTVLYHHGMALYDLPENMKDAIVIVDHPVNNRAFKKLLNRATIGDFTIVIASRVNEWRVIEETLSDDIVRSIKEIELCKLSLEEARSFAICIKNNFLKVRRTENELIRLFQYDSNGSLYASMLMAIEDKNSLEEIANQILSKICEEDRTRPLIKILAAIVFAEQSGVLVDIKGYKDLCRRMSIDEREPKYYLNREIVLNGLVYQTRHECISALFYKYLFGKENWTNIDDSEKGNIIYELLNRYFEEFGNATEDYRPTDYRVLNITKLFVKAVETIEYSEETLFLLQRLFESCKLHGHAVLNQVFRDVNSIYIKRILAEKSYQNELPLWDMYVQWIKKDMILGNADIESARKCLMQICDWPECSLIMWELWVRIEEEEGNIGNYETKQTAAWLYKAMSEKYEGNSHLWIAWSRFVDRHNLEKGVTHYSSSELLRKACLEFNCNMHAWNEWAKVEERRGNIGDYSIKGSAAWIYREMCLNKSDDLDGVFWARWAEFQRKYNGSGDYDTEESAAWIYKEACTKHNSAGSSEPWLKWAAFAEEYENEQTVENKDCYTVDNILRTACMEYGIRSSILWARWAAVRENNGEIGNYSVKESAAWIYKEACESLFDNDHIIWAYWEQFILKHAELHTANEVGMLRPIFQRACIKMDLVPTAWTAWAAMEEVGGNVGNYNLTGSAAWLHKEGCTNHLNVVKSVISWAKFAQRHELWDEGVLITDYFIVTKFNDLFELSLPFDEFKKSIGYIKD